MNVPCINWNKGFCQDSDLCLNCHLHGKCSECRGGHRAKDNLECQASLQTRTRERRVDDSRAGARSKEGPSTLEQQGEKRKAEQDLVPVVNIPIYSPFSPLLSIVSITFLISFRSYYLKHAI